MGMLLTKALLHAARKKSGIKSNYQLAKRLNITQTALSRYELGKSQPEPYIAARLADLASWHPGLGVAMAEYDRAKTAEERTYWEMRICVLC